MTTPVVDAPAAPAPRRSIAAALAGWWRAPRLTWWLLAIIVGLLALRYPSALRTPQLWAEDGSIFLTQQDLFGAKAFTFPYMGYLLTLHRLVAWVAAHTLDPAWWPAAYNGAAFAMWTFAIARLFSPRLDLPHRPWLALAMIFGAMTNEVVFNLTNLQWIAALLLVQQVLVAPPATAFERTGDLVIIVLVGLTGPFTIVFLPLFAWRLWRDRRADNLALLLVVAATAAVQAWFIVRTGPKFDYQAQPIHVAPIVTVLARRLLVWPTLGDHLALTLPKLVSGLGGGLVAAALMAWSLRPGPRRPLRAVILAAFALLTLAGMYRTRPDTWANDNLYFGDRYFYLPRVLLGWLFILEFDAASRVARWTSRLICLAVVVVHAKDYVIPAPPNYHWADHVDPIRRGVPGNIPTLPEGWTLEYRGRPARK
jgi:hypothetical protein